MKRWLMIAAFAMTTGAACGAAELVTLRNGFQMRCDHSVAVGGHVRLYMTAGQDNYIDLLASDISGVAHDAAPVAPTGSQPADRPSARTAAPPDPVIPVALTRADLDEMLARAGQQHNLDRDLLASVVHAESNGDPHAVSRAGAQGLMQLMPATAASMGVKNSFQPQQNVSGGSAYLDEMLTRYGNNLSLALAAYNAGPEAVDRYHGIPPYPETRAYVARVIHEFNRRVRARKAAERRASAGPALPGKSHNAISQK
ncbi:MAG TPA: lytic transglycosylase domain-containing protein [Terracidiphilus sp.]